MSETAADPPIHVLLVEDDEGDQRAARALLADVRGSAFELTWARDSAEGLRHLAGGACCDVVLLGHRPGRRTALEFLGRMPVDGPVPPVVLLAGAGVAPADLAVLQAGVADSLGKEGLTATMLERTVRYAVERQRTQAAKHEAEQRFQLLVESVGAIVWQGDPETLQFTFVSREAELLLGYPLERWTEEPAFWTSHVHPEDRDWTVALCRDASLRGEPHAFEYRMLAADGRVVWLRDIVRLVAPGGKRQLAGVMVDVTEAKQAEAERAEARRALEESHALLRAVVDGTPDAVFAKDTEGRYLLVNRSGAELLGLTADEMVGRTDADILSAEAAAAFREADLRVLRSGEPAVSEETADLPGGPRTYHAVKSPIRGPDGRITGLVGISRDISSRKEMEEALRASHDRFLLVQRATNDTIWDWDMRLGTLHWNEEITRVFGWTPPDGTTDVPWWLERVHPHDLARVEGTLHAALEHADAWSAEYRFRRADGSYAVALDRGHILRGEDGAPVRMIGAMQDVTEHRRLVQALAGSEAHYRRLVANAPQTIYALDGGGRFTEVNPAGEALLGRRAEDVLGRAFLEVIVPEDHAVSQQLFLRLLSGADPTVEAELRVLRPSGERRWVHLAAAAIRDGEGVAGVHGIARDTTEERAREARMRLFAGALENLAEGVNVMDDEGRIVFANAAYQRMLGYDPAAPPAEGILAFVPHAASRDDLSFALDHVRREGVWRGRLELRRAGDGHIIPVDSHMERVEQDGRSLVFTICRDVTAEIDQAQRLRRAERLASIGTLVGGVAHELNNPLAAIVGFTQLLLMDERTPGEREDLETIRREAERMAEIVASLRLLSRDTQENAPPAERVDVNDVVAHVVRTRAYSLRTHNVEVRQDLDPDLPHVVGNRGQLEQVVLNLIVNAEQSMTGRDEAGRLVLRTRRTRNGVSLHVVDNGAGIPAEHLDRVFDPFFTTKGPGEGTGLGLSLVHNLVAEHRGEIHVESRVGWGTAFRIDLPAALTGASAGGGAAAGEAGASAPRSLRVLVVDDEEPVRRVLKRYLSRRGHRVDEASEGGEALARVEAQGAEEPYDVIFSDLRMPGLGGGELLARLKQRGEGLERRLVFLTGDTAGAEAERVTAAEPHVPLLTKPIDLARVAALLERMGS